MKLSFQLLSAAAFTPLASADFRQTFTFKDDFFVKFCGIDPGLGPDQSDGLLDGLNANVEEFQAAWRNKIDDLGCEPVVIPNPEFSICDWKYPERYDILRLPLAGQCYDAKDGDDEDCYYQRFFYKVTDMVIECPVQKDMEDLDRASVLSEALEGMTTEDFSDVVGVGTIESVNEEADNDSCNAQLSINRYSNIDLSLKCLNDVYGTEQGKRLSEALDAYFVEYVLPKIEDAVEENSPNSAVYSVTSPFVDDNVNFCSYVGYYESGNLVDQYVDEDGIAVTHYRCGFDMVWYKDKDFSGSLLDDMVDTVTDAFTSDAPSFITFLQDMYEGESWVPNECLIDPNYIEPPSANPTTASPTAEPTTSPTKAPTSSPTEEPSEAPSGSPSGSPSDKPTDSPSTSAGPTSPTDTPAPTLSPTTAAPTSSPTNAPTSDPTQSPTNPPTDSPTSSPTKAPTASPIAITIVEPDSDDDCKIDTNFTEEDAPGLTEATCGDGKIGDGICAAEGACCSQWGWCGFSAEHCGTNSTQGTTIPTDPNAGRCGRGDGDEGDGTCLGENECCSEWGYCGTGNKYCYTQIDTETNESSEGLCGAGDAGEGTCVSDTHCCSKFGFCGGTDDYCDGYQPRVESETIEDPDPEDSPLPSNLQADYAFRCGIDETDARSNCGKLCRHHVQCSGGQECWGVQLNYCATFDEGTHPVCTDLDRAESHPRCGLDEASARGHCGQKCMYDDECPGVERCFDVMENLCDCHLENLRMDEAAVSGSSEDESPEDISAQEAPENIAVDPLSFDSNSTEGDSNRTDDGVAFDDETGDDALIDLLENPDPFASVKKNPFLLAREKIEPYFYKQVGEGSVEGLARDNASFQVNMSVALVTIASLNIVFSYCFM